jgi:hypothetical protein
MEYKLSKGEIIAFASKLGSGTLSCIGGELWVTFEGDSTDYHMSPDDRIVFTRSGKAVMQAMKPAHVIISNRVTRQLPRCPAQSRGGSLAPAPQALPIPLAFPRRGGRG